MYVASLINYKGKVLIKSRHETCKEVEVGGTWVWAPELSWYDNTNRRWIYRNEWKYLYK